MSTSGDSAPVRVLIGSAGRRVYLVRWFKEALARMNVPGLVLVTENDPTSSTFASADGAIRMPRYEESEYREAMVKTVSELRPDVFFSVNDYELAVLADGLADELRRSGTTVLSLGKIEQRTVEDKFLMAREFQKRGIETPRTLLASDRKALRQLLATESELIVKHRFGSGSSGLLVADAHDVDAAIALSQRSAPVPAGSDIDEVRDAVVIQPRLRGTEYGVDLVAPLSGAGGNGCAVLARRKIRMRAGETDKAATVDPQPFGPLMASLADVLSPQGLIDTDVIVQSDGTPSLIDVNPRFGGGYVFNHLAGADVPGYYLSQMLGRDPDPAWHRYVIGAVSAKFEDAVLTSPSARSVGDGPCRMTYAFDRRGRNDW